jgi:hypothetical protein
MSRKKREQVEAVGKLCRLCGLPKPLQRSHIIPEFFYEHLYDDKHSYWLLTTLPETERLVQQKGQREYLLCAVCEQQIQVYETYVHRLFTATDDIGVRYKRIADRITVAEGIDYKLFKLFQLSVLWRASVSTLPFFRRVQLGPLEEEIRQMLLRGDPGPAPLFSCMIWSLFDNGKKIPLMFPPLAINVAGRMHYKFIFGGYVWNFVASRTTDSREWDEFVLTAEGRLVFGQVTLDHIRPELDALIRELDEMGRTPHAL